jgi:hypothetical protein
VANAFNNIGIVCDKDDAGHTIIVHPSGAEEPLPNRCADELRQKLFQEIIRDRQGNYRGCSSEWHICCSSPARPFGLGDFWSVCFVVAHV